MSELDENLALLKQLLLQYHSPLAASYVEAARARIKELEAENEALRSAILDAHPAGQEEGAKPLEVLDVLKDEWEWEMTVSGQEIVHFRDGKSERYIIWSNRHWQVSDAEPTYDDIQAQLAQAQQQSAELRVALEVYGQHRPNCNVSEYLEGDCSCGYSEWLGAAAEKALGDPNEKEPAPGEEGGPV